MMRVITAVGVFAVLMSLHLQAADSNTPVRVLLLGDSIRLSYAPVVSNALNREAIVLNPAVNFGDSDQLLKKLERWLIMERPAVVHFNCGIHDIKQNKTTGQLQVAEEQYRQNLKKIVEKIRQKTNAVVLFSLTTPILDKKSEAQRHDADYILLNQNVNRYNTIAAEVMQSLDVPVLDLHSKLTATSENEPNAIGTDGVHLTEEGRELTGQLVAEFISQSLPTAREIKGPWKLEEWKQVPEVTWLNRDAPVRELTYKSEPYQGAETDVFAFYATPGSLQGDPSLDHDLPAVVLIHGGGGTAFAEWVTLWAQRGYAAIAMDLSGRRPDSPQFETTNRQLISNLRVERSRLEHGGPEAEATAKFQNVGDDLSDDWQPHAVAAVMRAHSLVRSFPEVDAERTAVTGISWGGYLTCLSASLDDRFKAAVPVYGCGFLFDGESVQKVQIDQLNPSQRDEWIRNYDPSAWLPFCEVPMLFVNGTNDPHYPLNSYMKSFDVVPGKKQLRLEAGMRHSHPHGWAPEEIGLFIDQHLRDGVPLPVFSQMKQDRQSVTAQIQSTSPLQKVEIVFTTDSGPLIDRNWQSFPVKFSNENPSQVTASIPNGATIWMLTATDSREAMITTQAIFITEPQSTTQKQQTSRPQ